MKKKLQRSLIFALICLSTASGSEVVSAIKKFVPTPTEAGFLVNAINVYMQVSQFVRSTNRLIKSVKETKEAWQGLTQEMEDVFQKLGKISELDPYNMSTWDVPLMYAQSALTSELWDVQIYFDMTDHCIIDAPLQYVKEVATLDDYNFTVNQAGKLVREKYFRRESVEQKSIVQYYQQTYNQIRHELGYREQECGKKGYSDEDKKTIEYLRKQKEYIESILTNAFISDDKNDSLVAQAEEIIKINLTEVRLLKDRLTKLQEYGTKLIEQYYNLTGNKVAFREMINKIRVDVDAARPEYDETDPDNVPPPERPSEDGEMEKAMDREVNQQDILALQNAIEFTMLQQEGILRDIEIMKVNTLAMITVFEAQRKWEPTEEAIITSIYAKRLSYDK
jgi:hypothetical protein